jgi:predicted amidophosphoribosyltransferase
MSLTDLLDFVFPSRCAVCDKAASTIGEFMRPLLSQIPSGEFEIQLVPAPSRPANFAKRGFQPTLEIAKVLASKSPKLRVLDALVLDKKVIDQVGLTKDERLSNLAGSMKVSQDLSGKICIILDDVVTTGATALEAHRALSLAGARVIGLLVFSESRIAIGEKMKIGLA